MNLSQPRSKGALFTMEKAMQYLSKVPVVTFVVYVFLVLSFGRAFCIMRIKTSILPLFVTELMVAVAGVHLLFNIRQISHLPKLFGIVLLMYFAYSGDHMLQALLEGNILALRDIVFFEYIIFFFMAYTIVSSDNSLKIAVAVIISSNVITLFFGRIFLISPTILPDIKMIIFVSQAKAVHFGFFYCIAIAFFIPLTVLLKNTSYKFAITILIALNIYMIVVLSQRSIWIAAAFLFCFFSVVLRKSFLRVLLWVLPCLMIMGSILYYFDYIRPTTRMPIVDVHISWTTERSPNVQLSKVDGFIRGMAALVEQIDNPAQNDKRGRYAISKDYLDNQYDMERIFYSSSEEEEGEVIPNKLVLALRAWMHKLFLIAHGAKSEFHDNILIESTAHSLFWRIELWTKCIDFALARDPVFGVGFGRYLGKRNNSVQGNAFLLHHERVRGLVIPAHNYLVSVFYKMGIVGLSLFLILVMATLFRGMRYLAKKKDDLNRWLFMLALCGSYIIWNVSALFFDVINSPPTSIFLWISMGLIHAVADRSKNVSKREGESARKICQHKAIEKIPLEYSYITP